jgi:hypothetical protein
MGTDTNFSKSGSSPGNVGNGFAFSGGSPSVGSFMSHSGSSPTSPRVRPADSRAASVARSQTFSSSDRPAHGVRVGGFSIEVCL